MAKTPSKVGKTKKALADISLAELQSELLVKKIDLIGYREGLVAGELKNPSVIRQTRREVARLSTEINKRTGQKGDN